MDAIKPCTQTFRCPPDLVEFIRTEAGRENRSLSQQVRHLLREARGTIQRDRALFVSLERDWPEIKKSLSDIQNRLIRLEKLVKAKPHSRKAQVK